MKNKLIKSFTVMTMAVSSMALVDSAQAAKIGFVAGLSSGALDAPFDIAWKARLESQGHTVTPIDQNTVSTDAVWGSVDLFIVSSDVTSGNIRDAGKMGLNRPKPYLVYEQLNFNDFFGGGGGNPSATTHTIAFSNSAHPLAQGVTGPALIYNGSGSVSIPTSTGGRSANATVVANRDGVAGDVVLMVLEAGQQGGANGTTTFPAMRIAVPCYATWVGASVTAQGWQILDNAISYAAPTASEFASFTVTAASTNQSVGDVFDVTITGLNASSQPVLNSTSTVFAASLTSGSLMQFDWNGDGTFGDSSGVLDASGSKTIKAINYKAQTATISASAGLTTTPSPLSIDTTADAYAKLQILAPGETAAPGTTGTGKTGTPIIQTLGTPFQVTVKKVDAFWNPLDPAGTFILFNATPSGGASVPSDAEDLGFSATHEITPTDVGSFTVTVTDDADASKNGTTASIPVLGSPVTWVGNVSDQWDTTTLNWNNGSSDVAFGNTNQVTFNDSGSANPIINLVETVTPSLVSVNNPTVDYTISGVGSISGVFGGFTKQGAGKLTLGTANTYTGPTTVSGGVLIPTVASALPSTSALTISGGLIGVQDIDFVHAVGSGAGQVKVVSGGFAAFGTTGVVNLGGNVTPDLVTMGSPNFQVGGTALVLGHVDATRAVEFRNPIALQSGLNFFQVADTASLAVDAILSGAISMPTGGIGFSKTGNGRLMLSNTGNSFTTGYIDNGIVALGADNVLADNVGFIVKLGSASGAQSAIDLNGFSDTMGTLSMGDTGSGNNGTPSIINSDTSTPQKAAATLTLNGSLNYNAGTVASSYGQATISANLNTGTGVRSINVANGAAPVDLLISGSLTGEAIDKTGLGALTVSSPNYTGNTTVTAGSLSFGAANPNNNASTVTIVANGVLNLNYAGTDVVTGLTINGVAQPNGVYGAAQHPGVITGTGTITVGTAPVDPFVTWAGAGVNFDDDANNDGVDNGLAWLLGALNPNVNANALLPVVTQTSGSLKLTFDMLPASARGGARLFIEHSSNLGISDPWTSVLVPDATGGTAPVTFVVGGASPLDVEATISSTEAAAGKLFGRVRAER